MFGMWAGEKEPLTRNLLLLWPDAAFGICMAQLTIALTYKMAPCDSFTGIKAHFQIPDWLIPLAIS